MDTGTPGRRVNGSIRLRRGAVEWRQVGDEVVVLDMHSSMYFAVNDAGAAIWPRLVAGATRAELVSLLEARYDVSAEDAASDVDDFLCSLRDKDLLEC